MGADANSIHLRADDQRTVVQAYTRWLRRHGYRKRADSTIPHYLETPDEPVFRRVLVSAPEDGWVTVVDQAHDMQDLGSMRRTCLHLSRVLECASLAFVVHDSQALYYFLCDRGVLLDRYCSWPGWYCEAPTARRLRQRWKASPERLLPLCRPGVTVSRLREILRDCSREGGEGAPPWPEDILRDLAECLGIVAPLRTYAGYHAPRPGVTLWLPEGNGKKETRLHLPTGAPSGPSWEGFVQLSFMKMP